MSGVGVWGAYEKTYLDIRIMQPKSQSYINKPVDQVYVQHEREKKRSYGERVLQIEKASFTPMCYQPMKSMVKKQTASTKECDSNIL